MFLITYTLAYDQYRHYSVMHSAKHNPAHHWRCAFMSDFFHNSQGKPLLFKWSSHSFSIGMVWMIVLDTSSQHYWFLLYEKLVAPTCSLFRQSRSHMMMITKLSPTFISYRLLLQVDYIHVLLQASNHQTCMFCRDSIILCTRFMISPQVSPWRTLHVTCNGATHAR